MKKIYILIILIIQFVSVDNILAQCAWYNSNSACTNNAPTVVGSAISCTPPSNNGGRRNFVVNNMLAGCTYRISNCGSGFDTQLTIRNSSGTAVGYNDDNGPACAGVAASIDFVCPANGQYWIQLNRWNCSTTNQTSGSITVTLLSCAAAPAYNPCSSIPILTCGNQSGNVTASGSGAWDNYGGPFGVPGQEKLFTFTPTTTGAHQLEVLGISGGWVDFFYKASSSGCNNSGWIYIDDVIGTGLVFPTVNLTAGVEYYFMWDPEGTGSYSVNFRVNCPTPPPPPPANDACSNATSLPCGTSGFAGTTVASASETAPGGGGLASNFGVWYTFTGDGQQTTISSTGTGGFDHEMTVLSGSCGALTLLTSQDGFGANGTETYTFNTVNGTVYYVYVAHWLSSGTSADVGTFTISRSCVTPAAGPANDNCGGALALSCGGTVTVNTTNATTDAVGSSTCGTTITTPGVWYQITGNGQQMTVSTVGLTGADTKLIVYSGSCAGLTCVGGNDDFSGLQSSVTWNSVSGTTYYVLAALFSGTGSFPMSLSCVTPTPPPANDNCANAQSITIQCPAAATAVSGTTANATEEAMADPSCDPGTIRDVWYTFNSGPNTSVDLTLTLGTASWIGGEVHTTCGNPAPGLTIGGNAGNCDFNLSFPSPTVISGLVPNTTYRLRLFTNVDYDIAGTFTFTLTNSTNNPGAVSIPASICVGTPTSISNVTAATGGPNNVNYYFYYRGGPSNLGWQMYDGPTTNTSSSLPTTVINTPGTWFIARNSDFGCGQANNATTLDLQIIVNEVSTAPALSGTSPVCPATSVVLNATGGAASPGSTINWYTGPNGTGSFVGSGSSYTVTPSATSTYYARREGGCNTTADGTYTITVNNPTLTTAPTNGDMVWRGASNTDWALLGNWWQYNGSAYTAANAAPTSAQNVIISANQTCVVNQPNTNANAGSAKTLRIESGATLTMGNGTITIAENWVNNGTFTPGTGTVSFTGSGAHTVSGISGAHNFHNLTMNKDGEVQLSVPIAMSGALTLTNGRLDIGNSNLDLASNTVNGGNTNSYVRTSGTGVVMRNVGASMVEFPVGRAAYNPAFIANAGTLDKFNVRVIDNVTDDGTAVGAQTTQAVVNRTWMVNEENSGGSNVTLRLYWNGAAEETNGFSPADGFIAHYLSSEGLWDNIGFTAVGAGYFETNNITSFSPFTISSSGTFAPLPVELIAFTAHCQNEDVAVNWSTATEHNSQYFALQVSEDGYSWSDLYVIEAAEFSTTVLEYAYIHKNAARTKNYYRLRQVDNDGTVETYNTILSNCTSDENVFMTFPNPSADAFTVFVNDKQLSGANVLSITDASGKLIYSIAVELENGSGSFAVEGLDMPAGLYYLQLNNGSYASRIIKHSFR